MGLCWGCNMDFNADLVGIPDGVWWGSDGGLVGIWWGCLDPAIFSLARARSMEI